MLYCVSLYGKAGDVSRNPLVGVQMYPSGSRGSPAKGVVRETAA